MPRRPTRRDLLLWGGGVTLSGLTLSGCGSEFLSLQPTDAIGTGPSGPKGKEAPTLAALVDSGDLPPVAERLPKNPLVLEPNDRIGQYGGVWRNVLLNANDTSWLWRTISGEYLLSFDRLWENEFDPAPNVAEGVEVSDDARVFTIYLREGMKWSDGEPFTAGDILFGYQDIVLNEGVNTVAPITYLTGQGEPPKLDKVDDYTVRIEFPRTNGLFLQRLATNNTKHLVMFPKHYLERFHETHNRDAEKLAKQSGFSSWGERFLELQDYPWTDENLPTINPWMVTTALGVGAQMVAQRNPYFWKVDPDGSQLPYLDRVTYDMITEEQTILLKATNGELDFTTRHINNLRNKPVLGFSRDRGQYHFIELQNTIMNDLIVSLNLTHKDKALRAVFQNKDFRIGLSHAINRQEMITAIWARQGEPWQAAPAPDSRFYDEEFGTQYLEFDVDLANELLDRAGLTEKDDDGFRLRPDGKPLAFQVDVATPAFNPLWLDGTDAVCRYWRAVGVNAQTRSLDRSLFYERKDNNQHDACVWMGDGGLKGEMLECRWYFPYSGESNYAQLWRYYFESRGKDERGEKPPEAPLKQMELYWELVETSDVDKQMDLMEQIIQIAKEQFYAIGTIRVPKTYGIVRNNVHNVPKLIPEAPVFNTPYPIQPAQIFKS